MTAEKRAVSASSASVRLLVRAIEDVMRYVRCGPERRTIAPSGCAAWHASIVDWIAEVSSVLLSPIALQERTSQMLLRGGTAMLVRSGAGTAFTVSAAMKKDNQAVVAILVGVERVVADVLGCPD